MGIMSKTHESEWDGGEESWFENLFALEASPTDLMRPGKIRYSASNYEALPSTFLAGMGQDL